MTGSEKLDVHRRLLEVLMISNPARIDELAIHLQAENVRQARFRSRPFARTDEVRRRLPEARVPLRAIWGANDSTSLPSLEVRYDALRESHPELQTRTIADAGHWVMYEQAAAYNAALVEMLEA
jgi:pimeloyl-ACP methyl ester carboxylesterase